MASKVIGVAEALAFLKDQPGIKAHSYHSSGVTFLVIENPKTYLKTELLVDDFIEMNQVEKALAQVKKRNG